VIRTTTKRRKNKEGRLQLMQQIKTIANGGGDGWMPCYAINIHTDIKYTASWTANAYQLISNNINAY